MIDFQDLCGEVRFLEKYLSEKHIYYGASVCSRAAEALVSIDLPKHPTSMTPDELLDFAMRFVEK